MRNKLMVIRYSCHEDLIIRLKSCFDMCNIKYVVYKECDFTDGKTLYKILIDKNKCTWNQVMDKINRVKPVKFNYEYGTIEDGHCVAEPICMTESGYIVKRGICSSI